ncbi:septal ring lytic transglycosylase RlpA family protein [Pontibacter liquoris]|uniref:septal ring lytic transglycosylase RlpA family protein n=1 Tax=Pontibacter liquoris TaxID=2905677 RepID=UPI001FA801FD|nr:septal ring lytic transglycosylase RlpA family protein [Pontibacter liquoris]
MNLCSLLLVLVLSFLSGNTTTNYTAKGKASYYADRMHGQRTASGARYDKTKLTAAHASLPYNTKVLVTNLANGKTVVVTINDRMARNRHNIIDLSKAAAKELDIIRAGYGSVSITLVDNATPEQQDTPAAVSE